MLRENSTHARPDGTPINVKSARDELRVKRVELVVRCQELARFLRGFDENPWAEWVEARIGEISVGNPEGVEELLEGFCGIGSISDVYLCPEAGHRINAGDENGVNEQFLVMLSKVSEIARRVLALSRPLTQPVTLTPGL